MRLVPAQLHRGPSRLGWCSYWIVDRDGNQLHTEPVCTVPEAWHDWFKAHIEAMEFDYWGVAESPAVAHQREESGE